MIGDAGECKSAITWRAYEEEVALPESGSMYGAETVKRL
jgi:hypothetical protein